MGSQGACGFDRLAAPQRVVAHTVLVHPRIAMHACDRGGDNSNRLRVSTTRTNHTSKSLGGGGYIEILGNPEGADHTPIISQGWVGSFEGFRAKS
jgi:hypothetical protein